MYNSYKKKTAYAIPTVNEREFRNHWTCMWDRGVNFTLLDLVLPEGVGITFDCIKLIGCSSI
jgi:hypothetical protein